MVKEGKGMVGAPSCYTPFRVCFLGITWEGCSGSRNVQAGWLGISLMCQIVYSMIVWLPKACANHLSNHYIFSMKYFIFILKMTFIIIYQFIQHGVVGLELLHAVSHLFKG